MTDSSWNVDRCRRRFVRGLGRRQIGSTQRDAQRPCRSTLWPDYCLVMANEVVASALPPNCAARPESALVSRRHLVVLAVLQLLFLARVIAQLVQSRWSVDWLPGFDEFQSGALSYRALGITQIAILGIQSWVVFGVARGRRILNGVAMRVLGTIGIVYFVAMVARLVAGATVASGHSWIDNPIPSLFHLVLASFLGTWVHYSRTRIVLGRSGRFGSSE